MLIVNEDAFDERNLDKAGYHDGAGGTRSTRSTTAASTATA